MSEANQKRRESDKEHMKHNLLKSVIISVILLMGVSNAWGATLRYIYVGISKNYYDYKEDSQYGFNFWGGTSGGVKSGTYLTTHTHDGRKYYMYRVQVYDDNNKAQFKGNNNWWDPGDGVSVKLNGTNNNAVFFSHTNDGWLGQFQENYQETSTAKLTASSTSVITGTNVTLTPSLSSNATYNQIKSTTYTVSTNPNSGGSVSSAGVFSATKAGTYTVTATVTYNPKYFTGITKTATATQTIKVYDTQYVLRGSQTANGDPKGGMAGWDATNNNAYTSATINGNTMTIVANLTNAKTQYKFMIYNNFDGSYYGQKNNAEIPDNTLWTLNGSNDVKFTTTAAGPYTFIYNTSNKSIKVQYPTAYTVTYSRVPTAAANAPTTTPSFSSGDYVLANTSVTFTAKTANTGYTWTGWYSNNSGTGDALSTNLAYTRSITANTTIYAVYTANTYTVKFDANGGSGNMSNQNFTYGTAQNLTANTFTRTGYTFAGWATSANGNKVYDDKQSVSNLSSTNGATVTLYAKWTATNYTITYNTNGGNSIAQKNYTIETATFDLPTPTKTGHTFAGWYDNENLTGNKVTQVAKGSTGNKTFYAAWTINQYTLTYSAGEGGTVSGSHTSGTKIDYNTSITLTANPAEGNILSQWVDEDGKFVSFANPYTFNLAAKNTTLKAEFAPPTTVYLKPEGYWPDASARFAIIASAAGKQNKQVNMQSLGCENEYYSANVPVGYTTYKYVRVNPSNTSEIWNETGVYNVQDGKNKLHVATRIYFKPDVNWKSDNARFAVYFYKSSNDQENLWRDLIAIGDDYYVCNNPGTAYDRAIFCRMNPSNKANEWANKWNQTNDLYIDINSIGGKNLYTITKATGTNMEGDLGTWSTHWETFTTPTYPLTLKATPYGEYTVKCNGVSYTSSRTKDIVIDLPVGATVEITKAESYDAAYNNNLVIKTSSNSQYEAAELNTTYTFCGETTIEENFTTTADHVVFLRVETSSDIAATWNNGGTNNYVYSISNLNRLNDIVGTVTQMTEVTTDNIYKENDYTYYTCTIPQGCNTFRFERKTSANADATNETEYFEHLLPLGQSNCFTIKGKNSQTFYGDWSLGTAEGDYRILYVEQQVAHGTDENAWKTVINTTYQHSSDIIKKGNGATIVSLHIDYDEKQNPLVILQKFTNGEWVDVEGQTHMVLGPLTASADMAMLPGRRNTEGDVNLRYGDGIEEIKADAETGIEGRVWNFTVQQSDASAYIDFTAETFEPYTGNYYIRTDNAAGGWMTYAIPSNVMSRSEYSLEHSGYSHYFCKWVTSNGTPNVKFVVANDYGAVISDTIASDDFTDPNGTLEANANVRWMWNEYTNIGSRAYIAGSSVSKFLVAKYVSTESQDKTGNFKDMGDWVYEADLENVQIDDKLTSIAATYDAQVQELLEKSHIDAGGLVMLASAGNDARVSYYTVRIVYDFKINQTICYLIPTGTTVATSIDVLIERINQDEEGNATQVTAAITPANAEVGITVYGLITLTKDHITNSEKSEQEALTYWISFPFDVKIGDITGFGEVGKHWMIKYYDGAERAEKGWFLDTKTFWKFFLDTDSVMKANTGYVLTLNKSLLNASNPVYDNTETLRLYFPSKEKITGEINSGLTKTTVDVPEHWCNITSPADRTIKDSHWNMIGVPSFANKTITTTNETVKYFYDYSHKDDKYNTAQNAGAKTFKPMHAYMVQFAGVIDWNSQAFDEAQKQLAAKKNADAEEQYTLRLELQQNGTKADQTFVELHDDATTMFDMNVDLTKMFNASSANIYTLIGSDNQVAANVMPIANTTIPVGVQIAKAGEYTFAMPDGTDGIIVELIDYETNTRTNLLLSDYTTTLPQGICENRFALSVKPDKVATDVEHIGEGVKNNEAAKKYIIDGKLFLQKNGMLYDAQGHIVR